MNLRLDHLFLVLLLLPGSVFAELEAETPTTAELPKATAHWAWVGDLNFNAMEAGKAFLVDGDSGQMLGMLSTGFFFASAMHDSAYTKIYSPETYLSRGTRGERTDVIAVYDAKTLSPVDEIVIPPKHFSGVPIAGHAAIGSDDRFIVIYNFTPAQSVSLVDVKASKFIREIETPGCAEVFSAGPRAFNMLCGDGSMLTLTLNENGEITTARSEVFFDPKNDIIDDKMTAYGESWLFFTRSGKVQKVDMADGKPQFAETWSLFSEDQLKDNWLTGGYQYVSVCESSGELYVLVHRGGRFTHKSPGQDVWVYDLKSHKRVRTIELTHPATAIHVSDDATPLLFSVDAEHGGVQVYDAANGDHRHDIANIAASPVLIWGVNP